MGTAIYNRAMVRESAIWPSFLYGLPNTDIEATKTIIFGLYANTYKHGHNYLEDIEAEELQRLVDIYDANISELDMEEQSLVLEIAAKRYIKAIEIQIKNAALATKEQQFEMEEDELAAKIAAFAADQEVITTKQAQLQLLKDKAVIKNTELGAKITAEQAEQNYVDLEISEKILEASNQELNILLAGLRGLEIQFDITNTSLQIAEAEASKSKIDVDIAMIEARTAEKDLAEKRLEVDEAEFDAYEYEIDTVADKRIELIEERGDIIEAETSHNTILEGKESVLETAQKAEQDARKESTKDGFDDRSSLAEVGKLQSEFDDTSDKSLSTSAKTSRELIATERTVLPGERKLAATTHKDAAISAATTLAAADITTTVEHTIGAA